MLRDPSSASHTQLHLQSCNPVEAERMLARLQDDIQSCVDCDRVYSPAADAKRQLIGETSVLPRHLPAHLPTHLLLTCTLGSTAPSDHCAGIVSAVSGWELLIVCCPY